MKKIGIGIICVFGFFIQNSVAQNKQKEITSSNKQIEASSIAMIPNNVKETIHWIPFQDAVKKSLVDGKPIMIDVYTDWCGYCKRMDATTFIDTSVISYVNSHFYAVKFNAETTETFRYRDSVYTNSRYVPDQKKTAHDLAIKLTNNHLVYPTLVFLVEDKKILAPVPGMQTVETIQPFLFYFGEQVYTITNLWEAFIKGYSAPKFTN